MLINVLLAYENIICTFDPMYKQNLNKRKLIMDLSQIMRIITYFVLCDALLAPLRN